MRKPAGMSALGRRLSPLGGCVGLSQVVAEAGNPAG